MVTTMAAKRFIEKLRQGLQRFRLAQGGNVILTFALATIPIIGFVGAAVDYSRGNSAKAAMQAAVDSTALMLSKDAVGLDAAALTTKATSYFQALFNRPEVSNIVIVPTLSNPTAGGFHLEVVGTGSVPTTFSKVIGQSQLKIDVKSEVAWGMKQLELVLALDNTFSMLMQGRMTALKTASKSLLTILQQAAGKPGDIKVAIIPFNTFVNVGNSYKTETWFNWTLNSVNSATWTGCVQDRDQPNDVSDTTPSPSNSATLFPAIQCDVGPFNFGYLTSLLPLTSDWAKLNAKVDAMLPDGTTNITIGLVWALHAATQNAPLKEAQPPNPNIDRVIVLMTDGDNTENRWGFVPSQIDARTQLACNNIKAAGIKLYTIRLMEGNEALLKSCASSATMYFNVTQAAQLNTVFTAIATNLAKLRIAK